MLTEVGEVEVEVPRDRGGSFEPKIVRERQRRMSGVDELVISLAAKGLTTFDIDLRDIVADDEHMVAIVHYHQERADGVFDQDGVELFSLDRDGKITAFWAFVHDSAAFDEFFG